MQSRRHLFGRPQPYRANLAVCTSPRGRTANGNTPLLLPRTRSSLALESERQDVTLQGTRSTSLEVHMRSTCKLSLSKPTQTVCAPTFGHSTQR